MMTRARAMTTAITRTCTARRATITNSTNAHLGTMADGARGAVAIIMKMEIEIATDSAIIMAIGIPEAERENLTEAVAERCQAQRHGALIAPLGHPLSVLTKLGTPSVGVPDAQ